MFNRDNCRCRHAGERDDVAGWPVALPRKPFPISHQSPSIESTYVNHGLGLLVIFALCSYNLGPAMMLQDGQLICEKQIPKALALLSLFLHQHLLMFETAYFILDFLHLRIVWQQKMTEKSVQKSIILIIISNSSVAMLVPGHPLYQIKIVLCCSVPFQVVPVH